MNRRNVLRKIVAGVLGVVGVAAVSAPEASALTGPRILAVSVFNGQGSQTYVDTGLSYNGIPVGPTFVAISAEGKGVYARTGYWPHQPFKRNDLTIDVNIEGNIPWTGLAYYIK